jgi:hypothetical protein
MQGNGKTRLICNKFCFSRILVDGKQNAISYGHLPGRAIARAKRLIDAELDKNFGQKTVGLKGSEMDIRRCTKEDLDAIDERLRAWKAEQNVFYVALPYNDVLEAPH